MTQGVGKMKKNTRTGFRAVVLAVAYPTVLAFSSTSAFGQAGYGLGVGGNPTYGIPPSANTQQALANPPGLIEGALDGFYASLGIAVGQTDNALRAPEKESDTITAFTPGLGYASNLGRHSFKLDYIGFGERYQDFTNLDSTDHRFRGVIDFDVTQKLDWDVFAGYGDVNERRGTSGSQILQLEPNEVEIVDYGTTLRYGTRRGESDSGAGRSACRELALPEQHAGVPRPGYVWSLR